MGGAWQAVRDSKSLFRRDVEKMRENRERNKK